MVICHKTKFLIDLYGATINFYIGDDPNAIYEQVCTKHKVRFTPDDTNYYGLFWKAGISNYHIAIKKDSVNYNTVSHEVYHATCCVMRNVGIDDEEAMAWVCGYISEKIYDYLHTNNIKVNYAKPK